MRCLLLGDSMGGVQLPMQACSLARSLASFLAV